MPHPCCRRTFLLTTAQSLGALSIAASTQQALFAKPQEEKQVVKISDEVGITTSSLSGHLAARPKAGQFSLLELPRLLRDELGMRVIDLNTSSLASTDPRYLEKCRNAAEKVGCVFTNLKMNQKNLDMNSPNRAIREKALREYKKSIAAAALLGARWARPLPMKPRPNMKIHVASYQELADYGAQRGVQMLVENYGWMESDPESNVKLVKAIDRNVAICPDTGNWSDNKTRYEGLARSFPTAVTCDFKARTMGPNGEYDLYDLKRCYEIGVKAGFRGPWCLEHANRDRKRLFRELSMLRDMIHRWMGEGE